MFDSARALVEAGLRAEGLVEGTGEFRRRYLQRMYGGELTEEQIERIVARALAEASSESARPGPSRSS
jgi:hypothetical protein